MEVLLNNDIMKGGLLPDGNHAVGFFWEIGLPIRMILISVLLLCSLTVMIASIKWICCSMICDLLVEEWYENMKASQRNGRKCLFICPPSLPPPLPHHATTPPVSISSEQAPGGLLETTPRYTGGLLETTPHYTGGLPESTQRYTGGLPKSARVYLRLLNNTHILVCPTRKASTLQLCKWFAYCVPNDMLAS